MAIWLNYTHIELKGGRRILPNYLFLLGGEFQYITSTLSEDQQTTLHQMVIDGTLHRNLEDPMQAERFDDTYIWEILLAAYPYEVQLKYLQEKVENDSQRNEKILQLFDSFFAIDYRKVLEEYCATCNRSQRYKTALITQDCLYASHTESVDAFLWFIDTLLRSQWYLAEAEAYAKFAKSKLHISFVSDISGVTTEVDDEVYISIGNSSCTTLFHELAHFTNRFFRFHYNQNYEVCFDNYTKTNEWFADFVAYHLHKQIMSTEIEAIETMTTEPLFFSAYIDVYATLREHGSNDRKHNFDLIYQEMKRFDGPLFSDQKAHFYFERFYKFFHYDQHEYFYPKELMYYLGYESIRKLFAHAADKKQLLTQLFLGKICV